VGGEKIGGEGSWGQVFGVFRFRFPHCPLIESFVAAKLGKSEREMANGKWKTGEMRKMERRPKARGGGETDTPGQTKISGRTRVL